MGKAFGLAFDITEGKKIEQELKIAKDKVEAALHAKELAEKQNRKKTLVLKDLLKTLKQKRYYLSAEYNGIYLTQREMECLLCLMHGKSAKQIGKELNLALRTIEFYLDKIKLNCDSSSILIEKTITCRFIEGVYSNAALAEDSSPQRYKLAD
jgi:DNA-binding CsgD family transcriptional regulator